MFISLPNDKISDYTKLKALADDKINMTQKSVWHGLNRKHCGKRRKCWLQHYSQTPSFSGLLKVWIVW